MMKLPQPVILALALAGPLAAGLLATPPIWGGMEAGPCTVGYRILLLRDRSRPAVPVTGVENPPATGRLVPVHLWYPAQDGAASAPLRFGDYIDRLAYNVDARPLDDARRQAARARFLASAVGLGGDRAKISAVYPTLLALETTAHPDAPAAAGKFPLIIFPEFQPAAGNSSLAEYLASHGYIVATTGMRSQREETWTVSLANLETLVTDLQFMLGSMADTPAVDLARVATIGVGISANAGLALQMRDPRVQAHVSLDGGVISPSEDRLLRRTPYFDAAAVRGPMLFIWAPHPSLIVALADAYKYASRRVLAFPGMSEFRFLNYGLLEKFAPELIGRPPGDTATGYKWAARYVRAFLDAHLRADAAARAFLEAPPEANGVPAGTLAAEFHAALPPPPSLAECRALILRDGVAAFATLYRELKRQDPQPFTAENFIDLYNWAQFVASDPDWAIRQGIAELRLDAFPASARAHFTYAGVAAARQDTAGAIEHYRQAVALLAADRDPLLDDGLRQRITTLATEALQRLQSTPARD